MYGYLLTDRSPLLREGADDLAGAVLLVTVFVERTSLRCGAATALELVLAGVVALTEPAVVLL